MKISVKLGRVNILAYHDHLLGPNDSKTAKKYIPQNKENNTDEDSNKVLEAGKEMYKW